MARIVLTDGSVVDFGNLEGEELNAAVAAAEANLKPKAGEEGFEHDFSALETLKNIPSSAGQFVEDITYPFRNLPETVEGISNLGGSLLSKGQRKVQELASGTEIEPGDEEAYADAMFDFMKGRYGGIEELQKTLQEDPVGFMSDLSAVITGGATLAAKVPGQVGKLGKIAQMAGAGMEPVALASTIASKAAKPLAAATRPSKRYEKAIRFPAKMDDLRRERAIQTGLDEGLMPSRSGIRKLADVESGYIQKLDDLITKHADAGAAEVPAGAIHQALGELRDSIGVDMGSADAIKQLDEIEMAWRGRMQSLGKDSMTLQEIQKFKTDTYDLINWNRKDPSRAPIQEKAYKAAAREGREQIEKRVPEIREINDQLAGLYELEEPLRNAANRAELQSVFGLGGLTRGAVVGSGGMALGVPPAVVAAMSAAGVAVGHPKIQAAIALITHKLKNNDVDWLKKNMKIPAVNMVVTQLGRYMDDVDEPLRINIQDGRTP
jgi:hypothetical protein